MLVARTYEDENGYLRYEDTGKLVHRHVAEKKLGSPLKPWEVVHHIDRNKTNNDPHNLWVCRNQDEHDDIHNRDAEKYGWKASYMGFGYGQYKNDCEKRDLGNDYPRYCAHSDREDYPFKRRPYRYTSTTTTYSYYPVRPQPHSNFNTTQNVRQENITDRIDFVTHIKRVIMQDDEQFLTYRVPENNIPSNIVMTKLIPDIVVRHKPTDELFAVECKYITQYSIDYYSGKFYISNWSDYEDVIALDEFRKNNKLNLFVIIGLGYKPSDPERIFCIPFDNLDKPDVYIMDIEAYERKLRNKPFVYQNGKFN
jgi:hypothetical protein